MTSSQEHATTDEKSAANLFHDWLGDRWVAQVATISYYQRTNQITTK
jgi:hypothetical protein